MLQEAMDEGFSREGASPLLFGLAVLIGEGDLVMLHFENTLVAQGDAEDIGGQILEGRRPSADGTTIHDPCLSPDRGRRLGEKTHFAQAVTHLATEEFGQRFDVDEEVILGT